MSFYENKILPRVINCACGMKAVDLQRAKVVPLAQGQVLELGIGTGLNVKHYDAKRVSKVIGVDPSEESWQLAQPAVQQSDVPVEYLQSSAEEIPLATDSVDTAVITYTLCTIPDPSRALAEVVRVLRPGGRVLVAEHALAPDASVAKWQNRVNGFWGKMAGGCHINRDICRLIEATPLQIQDWQAMYLPQTPKIAGYNVWGTASLS
jgi:ubiquinone/menaquinone biosynthesis C-methylase UbiE|tara:strand:- start:590 stop:1210 length:621 start_codon:yes stop_codon:yes gene_type:complete